MKPPHPPTDSAPRPTTGAWIWKADGVTWGLTLDGDRLLWTDAVGSLCGDDLGAYEQTRSALLRDGPPPAVGPLPQDVRAELLLALDSPVS